LQPGILEDGVLLVELIPLELNYFEGNLS